MIDLNKFDPTDSNEAMQAAEAAVTLAVEMLQWRARSWPNDPSLSDGGWAQTCRQIIQRYGNIENLAIPELYKPAIYEE